MGIFVTVCSHVRKSQDRPASTSFTNTCAMPDPFSFPFARRSCFFFKAARFSRLRSSGNLKLHSSYIFVPKNCSVSGSDHSVGDSLWSLQGTHSHGKALGEGRGVVYGVRLLGQAISALHLPTQNNSHMCSGAADGTLIPDNGLTWYTHSLTTSASRLPRKGASTVTTNAL